jgi:hypothetical protein
MNEPLQRGENKQQDRLDLPPKNVIDYLCMNMNMMHGRRHVEVPKRSLAAIAGKNPRESVAVPPRAAMMFHACMAHERRRWGCVVLTVHVFIPLHLLAFQSLEWHRKEGEVVAYLV